MNKTLSNNPSRFARRARATGSLALATVMFLTACGSGGGPADDVTGELEQGLARVSPSSSSRAAPASGEEVFNGVFFGSGAVGKRLSLWSDEARAQVKRAPREVQIAKLENAVAQMKVAGWSRDAIGKLQQGLDGLRRGDALPQLDAEAQALQQDFFVGRLTAEDPTFFGWFGGEMQSGDPVRVDAAFSEAALRVQAIVNAAGREGVNGANRAKADDDRDLSSPWFAGPYAVAVVFVVFVIVAFFLVAPEGSTLSHDEVVADLADELHHS